MSKRTLFIAVLGIVLLAGLVFAYSQEANQEKAAHKISGVVLAFSPTELKVQTRLSGSASLVLNFKLTGQTRFFGTLGVGKPVRVIYLRKKINKRISGRTALSVEVLSE